MKHYYSSARGRCVAVNVVLHQPCKCMSREKRPTNDPTRQQNKLFKRVCILIS